MFRWSRFSFCVIIINGASKRYEFEINGDLLSFYKCLRDVKPSPYMYYLKLGERTIIGSSPEMLMRVTSNKIETFPIAGTRPITENPKINNILKTPQQSGKHKR